MSDRKEGPRKHDAALSHAYRVFNGVFLGLAVYAATYPLVSRLMGSVLPGLWGVCPYLAMTGRPCPLCGLTRAFGALARGDWRAAQGHNSLAVVLAATVAVELALRVVMLRVRPDPLRSVIPRVDVLVHGMVLAAYAVWAVAGL